ncbi:hypothetical protein P8891_05745 [Bacillus atrophaeus]|uniref:DUF5983 family protein n=1 Tax=Bacillus atrophaeus TaxID=1452 RepID=UPI00227DD328|nr:hypothetical protein [Bacillus atrophaeus]MCY7947942.1 hypothetical protein [Bacillus atrophaeus]MCY8098259.1 hypothetical protein [Bacillus atrophaeus]MCY9170036.1 hypothetical protein [Bacillus atrophaeus]MEC0740590.1 hypothetical protein [Bacillus atrophaeus]MEC0746974.1 hypothetical protein [Bacillus atrophaeus]
MRQVKMMEISTSNLKEETRNWLDEQVDKRNSELITYSKESYGYFIPLFDEMELDSVPNDLRKIIDYAISNSFEWVMFDCDAEESQLFEVFE